MMPSIPLEGPQVLKIPKLVAIRDVFETKYGRDFYTTETLKYPLTTEFAMKKIDDNNTLVFIVDIQADKRKIKDAVKKLYNIQTKKVNTIIKLDGTKKAYVRLTPDYDDLDLAIKIGII
ncbi:hypothetical protein UlMin_026326 [Ulmus minor]